MLGLLLIRGESDDPPTYGLSTKYISVAIHCGGSITTSPEASYEGGETMICDFIDATKVSLGLLSWLTDMWGLEGARSFTVITEDGDNKQHFKTLDTDQCLRSMCQKHTAANNRRIDVYVRHMAATFTAKPIPPVPFKFGLDMRPSEFNEDDDIEDEFENALLAFAENEASDTDESVDQNMDDVAEEEIEDGGVDEEAERMVELEENEIMFGIGMVFNTSSEIKHALREHGSKNDNGYVFVRKKGGVTATCREEGCSWRLEATLITDKEFRVTVHNGTHKCGEMVPTPASEAVLPIEEPTVEEEICGSTSDKMMNEDVDMDLVQELLHANDDASTKTTLQQQVGGVQVGGVEPSKTIEGLPDGEVQATQTTLDILKKCKSPMPKDN